VWVFFVSFIFVSFISLARLCLWNNGNISPLQIGPRGSPLAMAQAFETRRRLQEPFLELNQDGAIGICVLKTQGDMILDKSLMELGGQAFY
jgi:hydroxymethylbilane synthase